MDIADSSDSNDGMCQCKSCKNCNCCDDEVVFEVPYSGNTSETYRLNCLWVRVQYIREYESPATIEEVYYRN